MNSEISVLIVALLIGCVVGEELENQTGDRESPILPVVEKEIVFEGLGQNVVHLNSADSIIVAGQFRMEKSLELLSDEIRASLKSLNERLDALLKKSSGVEPVREVAKPTVSKTCADIVETDQLAGVYKITVAEYGPEPFEVYCIHLSDHGDGWTLVLHREDGSLDFNRPWRDYQEGFGNVSGEFFIGLDKLHAMTSGEWGEQELLVRFMAFDSSTMRHAKYDAFVIGDEQSGFAILKLGVYSGDGGDALRVHKGMKFSTKDVDNDLYSESCAQKFQGGWWFNNCVECQLTGLFVRSNTVSGIEWSTSPEGPMSMEFAEMMIRPRPK